jgi:hypothetical protein
MTKTPRIRRLVLALVISGVVNIVWLGLDVFTANRTYGLTIYRRIELALGTPGAVFATWIAPSGHEMGPVLIGVLIAIIFSLFFYATVAWLALSVLAWLRSKVVTESASAKE